MSKLEDLICVRPTPIPGMRPLLVAWTEAVLHYCDLHGHNDNPWWFNERATLSTLAGAAWNKGWAAIEEFTTEKRKRAPEGIEEGDLRRGRCDLYIKGTSQDYAIEAKQAWQSIGGRSSERGTAWAAMQKAWEDASALQAAEGDYRLAVTFVVPFLAPTEAKKGIRAVVERWLKQKPIKGWHTANQAYAHVFPRRFTAFRNEATGYCYPGVVMVVEQRRRGFKSYAAT